MIEKNYVCPRGTVRYWVSHSGHGVPLVLLHGLTVDHTLFTPQVAAFDGTHPLLIWDAPGHGASRPYENFTYPNLAEDLHGILLAERFPRAVLIGQSMGGFVAQAFIRRWPEMAAGFISVDSCPLGHLYTTRPERWLLRQMGWMTRLYPYPILVDAMARRSTCTRDARESTRMAMSAYTKDELCTLMGVAYSAYTQEDTPVEISCPALLLVGEHDRLGKVRAYGRAWSKKTGIPLRVVCGAAHIANYDRPDEVNRLIAEFAVSLSEPKAANGRLHDEKMIYPSKRGCQTLL